MNLSDAFFLSRFETYLSAEMKASQHTVAAYMADLSTFLNFCSEQYELKSAEEISSQFIRSWLSELMSDGLSPITVNRKISSLKTYFRYLRKHKLVSNNPMLKITGPKKPSRLPVFIEESKMEDLLAQLINEKNDEKKDPKFQIALDILLTLYHTGMRLNELIHLEKQNLDISKGLIRVLGKRNKERLIPLTEEATEILVRNSETQHELPFIFTTNSGKKLYPKFVYRAVKGLLENTTTIKKKSPHVLRHTFATHLLNKGADLNAIKELLGHSGLNATQIYTHNSVERLKNIYKTAHPKSNKTS